MAYFFAYGDRMNTEKMQAGSPSARVVGPGRLDGYRLAFNVVSRSWGGGAANAVPDPGPASGASCGRSTTVSWNSSSR